MKLLPDDKLIWSPVVANSRMNRERNSSGINSYEQEFKFKPEVFIEEKINELGKASWLDLCCGYGKALIQTSEYFQLKNLDNHINLKGVDLIENFFICNSPNKHIQFEYRSVSEITLSEKYDLVTCVHGLHYLGDKLKVIQMAVNSLKHSGLFIANLDLDDFQFEAVDTRSFLKKLFREQGFDYNFRTKILKRDDFAELNFPVKYLGADDTRGANYTGQESVTSYYAV